MVADLARAVAARPDAPATSLMVVCRDGPRMAALARALEFFAPDLAVLEFPAWDCLPYDRMSPHAGFVAQRMTALARLARVQGRDRPSVLLTSVNAALQRVPRKAIVAQQSLAVAPGNMLAMDGIVRWLELNGFARASTVREPGDYAVRGGIIDLYAPGMAEPVRLDFFGDTLETIRSFDPETQRTTDQLRALDLVPVAEFQLTTETIRRFRTGYVAAFGAPTPDDQLYHAVSEGRRYGGMEHWLPLFHDGLDTVFDYVPGSPVVLEPLAEDAAHERFGQIADYYEARVAALSQRGSGPTYKPLPPDRLYLAEAEWGERLNALALARLTPFAVPDGQGPIVDVATRAGHNFAAERTEPGRNVFEAVAKHVKTLQANGKRVVIALWSEGARERMGHVLADHGLANLSPVDDLAAGAGAAQAAGGAGGARARERVRDGGHGRRQRAGHSRRSPRAPAPGGAARRQFHRRGDGAVRRRSGRPCRSRHRPLRGPARDRSRGRAARLPGDPLRRRRQAVPAGRERGAALALRLGGDPRRPRPARQRRLAGAQGAHEAPHSRDRQRPDQDRGRAPAARSPQARRRAWPVRRVLRGVSLRGDRRSAGGDRRGDERACGRPSDGPPDLRRCRVRQDRGRAAGGVRHRHERPAGRGRGADHAAGAPAHQDIHRALPRLSGADRAGLAAGRRQGACPREGRHRRRLDRYRGRHPCAARQEHQVPRPRAADRRRGAAFRCRPQGEAQAAARRGARADAHGHADPAYLAACAVGRARPLDHRLAAGRPAGGAHLRGTVRSRRGARGAVARALPRRPGVLRLPAHRGPRRRQGIPGNARARNALRGRAWTDAADRARRYHVGVLRRQVRHPALDHDHRVRASTFRPPTR